MSPFGDSTFLDVHTFVNGSFEDGRDTRKKQTFYPWVRPLNRTRARKFEALPTRETDVTLANARIPLVLSDSLTQAQHERPLALIETRDMAPDPGTNAEQTI